MWRDDIAGSRAHVAGSPGSACSTTPSATRSSPRSTGRRRAGGGPFEFVAADEDIHTAVERRVTELAGPAGGKLHTARSRNDQVATDLRLWCKRELRRGRPRLLDLQQVLLDRAIEAGEHLPARLHAPPAGPAGAARASPARPRLGARARRRPLLATVDRLDVSPLGAGALAGSSLPIDPAATAADLGFARPFDNSLDAVSDRDFVAEALFDLALVGVHLSRIGEEWVLWTVGRVRLRPLDDGFATGSSMLPQKKNPDIAELARGKSGRLIGNLTGLLATLKGLPLAYNRDLQEDKEPLFDSVEQVTSRSPRSTGMIATATFVPEAMQAAADEETTAATDLAEWLVRGGMPFREAHAIVGRSCVRTSPARALRDLGRRRPRARPGRRRARRPGVGVRMRRLPGAAGPERDRRQLAPTGRCSTASSDAFSAS